MDRPFRHELKHEINYIDSVELSLRLKHLIARDSFAREDGTYLVKSLYFDNHDDKALFEKLCGYNYREKFRIRYYNNDLSFIRIEKKSKINGFCLKETSPITESECRSLLNGDTGVLKDIGDGNGNAADGNTADELYLKMNYQLLRPKSIIEYVREAYACPIGDVRITIDSDIRISNDPDIFLTDKSLPVGIGNTIILEVKYNEFIPGVLRDAVQLTNRASVSYSKYSAARMTYI